MVADTLSATKNPERKPQKKLEVPMAIVDLTDPDARAQLPRRQQCQNCGRSIGTLEPVHLWGEAVVCAGCRQVLEQATVPAQPAYPAPQAPASEWDFMHAPPRRRRRSRSPVRFGFRIFTPPRQTAPRSPPARRPASAASRFRPPRPAPAAGPPLPAAALISDPPPQGSPPAWRVPTSRQPCLLYTSPSPRDRQK